MEGYANVEQSKELAETLPIESADMSWVSNGLGKPFARTIPIKGDPEELCACWSLAALLKYLSEIKPQEYTPILYPSEGKWISQFVEYGHGNVCEVSCDNPVDACYEMILKLNELNLL